MTGHYRHDWAGMLRNNHTEGTTRDYLSWADRFEDWREWADVSVSSDLLYTFDEFLSDPEEMTRFADEYVDGHSIWNRYRIPDEGYSYRTQVKALSAVKSYVDFEYDVEVPNQQRSKINNVVEGDPPAFDPPTASPDEVQEVFEDTETCSFGSCHPMTRLGYDAIMRCAEITRVEWDDVNVEKGRIYVRSAKGSPERWVTLSPKTVDVLIDHREAGLEHFDNPKWMFYRLGGFNRLHTTILWSRPRVPPTTSFWMENLPLNQIRRIRLVETRIRRFNDLEFGHRRVVVVAVYQITHPVAEERLDLAVQFVNDFLLFS